MSTTESPCEVVPGEFDHDMQWIRDWYGDSHVINDTADCSYWRCKRCGLEEHGVEPPDDDDDYQY